MDLTHALTRAITDLQLQSARLPTTARGVIRFAGGTTAMAALLAGTTDRRAPAYLSALRSVQRWRVGTCRPSPDNLERMRVAIRRLARTPARKDTRRTVTGRALAAQAFETAFFNAYGLPGARIVDVEELALTPGSGRRPPQLQGQERRQLPR